MRFKGIDPGRKGALVAVGDDGETALDVFEWTEQDEPSPELLARIMPGDVVTVEDQYIGHPHASKKLIEWTVRLLERLPDGVIVQRPNASKWRAKVFRCGRMRRGPAKRRAIAECLAHSGLDPELANKPDVAEAWAMARYAWGWAAAHLGQP